MATNKSLQRFGRLLLAVVTSVTAVIPARAGDWMPLLPDQNFYDFQLFAPPDMQDYEIYPEQSEGIFFNYDRLYWGITPPRVTGVGQTETGGYLIPVDPISPQAIVQLNNAGIQAAGASGQAGSVIGGVYIFGSDPLQIDLNTSWMRTAMTWGNRYEGGWIYDNRGVQVSYFNTGVLSQSFQTTSEFAASSPTQIYTQSAVGGAGNGGGGGVGNINAAVVNSTITSVSPPPDHLISQKLTQTNNTEIQSASVTALVRRELGRRGSGNSARFSVGPRFLQFAESYKLGYESNQYAFNQGTAGANQAAGGAGAGGAGAGGAGAGGAGAGGAGAGGAGAGGAGTGGTGTGGTGTGFLGNVGGNVASSISQTSAGDVLGIGGVDTLTGLGQSTPLQVGEWETNTYNNMVGPEFALLLESHAGRWTFSSELKFTAAFNWQNNLYRGANFPDSIGADYIRSTFTPSVTNNSDGADPGAVVQLPPPPLFLQIYGVGQQNATNSAKHEFVFSPIGEWRFGAQYRLSQAILLRAGYTGLWMAGISRAASSTGYKSDRKPTQYAEPKDPSQPASLSNPWVVKTTGPTGGVDPSSPYYREDPVYNRIGPSPAGGQEYVFTNGVDFGIEVKY
jgi:hypothetical protein